MMYPKRATCQVKTEKYIKQPMNTYKHLGVLNWKKKYTYLEGSFFKGFVRLRFYQVIKAKTFHLLFNYVF